MSDTTTPSATIEGIPDGMTLDDLHSELETETTEPGHDQEALATPDPEPDEEEQRIRLKINGKTVEKKLSEVIADAQKYAATNQKLEQAKQQTEQAKQLHGQVQQQQEAIKSILQVLQRGDIATIADFVEEHLNAGPQFQQAIIQYALKLYEMSKMSEPERQLEEHKKMLARYQREAEERQKQDSQRMYDMRVNQWSEYLNVELPKAMTEVGLPNNDWVRTQIVQTWQSALQNGQTPTAKAVAGFVKQQLEAANIRLSGPAPVQGRPRATAASVASAKRNGEIRGEPTQYVSFSDWQKSRRF